MGWNSVELDSITLAQQWLHFNHAASVGITKYGLLVGKQRYFRTYHIPIFKANIFSGKNGEDKFLLISMALLLDHSRQQLHLLFQPNQKLWFLHIDQA